MYWTVLCTIFLIKFIAFYLFVPYNIIRLYNLKQEIKNTHNPDWKKDDYKIVKCGNTNGKPMFALMAKNHERIKISLKTVL